MISSNRFSILVFLLKLQVINCFSNRVRDVTCEFYSGERLQLPQGFKEKSTQVIDAMECIFSCTSTKWCHSINIRTTPLENDLHVCELLSSDRFTNGSVVKQDNGYKHYSKKDKCRREKPCRNGGQCSYYEDVQDYRCICKQGTTGKDCEIIASQNNVYMLNSSIFALVTLSKTWEDGRLHCQTFGADLASFYSELESRIVLENLLNSSRKAEFGSKESYLVKLSLDSTDSGLTLQNGAKYENTDQGTTLYLDGVDGQVLVPRFVFYNKSFTFGAWIKLAASKSQILFSDDGGYMTIRSFNFRITDSNKLLVVMWFGDGRHGITVLSNGFLPINQWIHIGFTFDIDAGRVMIYLNGSLDSNQVVRPTSRYMHLYTPRYYRIGRVTYSNGHPFKGWIKNLLMIPRILQPAEMKALADGERRAWIGLNDKKTEGVFKWSDGKPLTYKNLNPFNTDTRDCTTARLVETFSEEWNMRHCQEESFFICRK